MKVTNTTEANRNSGKSSLIDAICLWLWLASVPELVILLWILKVIINDSQEIM